MLSIVEIVEGRASNGLKAWRCSGALSFENALDFGNSGPKFLIAVSG